MSDRHLELYLELILAECEANLQACVDRCRRCGVPADEILECF